jgi:hypothetical protein
MAVAMALALSIVTVPASVDAAPQDDLAARVSIEGAVPYLSHMIDQPPSTIKDAGEFEIEPWEEALHAAFLVKNDTDWGVTLDLVARASDWQGPYLGSCARPGFYVPPRTTARGTCTLIDAATGQPFSFPLGLLSSVKLHVDKKIVSWSEPQKSLDQLGFKVFATGLERVHHATRNPYCSFYEPWALVESTASETVGVMAWFLFFDADNVLIGRSGEVQQYRYKPGDAVKVSARMNPCFDEQLPQPVRVEIVGETPQPLDDKTCGTSQ